MSKTRWNKVGVWLNRVSENNITCSLLAWNWSHQCKESSKNPERILKKKNHQLISSDVKSKKALSICFVKNLKRIVAGWFILTVALWNKKSNHIFVITCCYLSTCLNDRRAYWKESWKNPDHCYRYRYYYCYCYCFTTMWVTRFWIVMWQLYRGRSAIYRRVWWASSSNVSATVRRMMKSSSQDRSKSSVVSSTPSKTNAIEW